jgi:hypothetical protein
MKWSNSAIVLVIVLLIFAALMLRNVNVSAYSLEEIKAELSTLCGQYAVVGFGDCRLLFRFALLVGEMS